MRIFFVVCVLLSVVLGEKSYYTFIQDKIVDASCFRSTYTGVVVRGYMSIGKVDPNLKYNLEQLGKAEIFSLVYMCPCPMCGNPLKQIKDLKEATNDRGKRYVIDLTKPAVWYNNLVKNREFISVIANEITSHIPEVGILTNREAYSKILGKEYVIPKSYLVHFKPDGKDACSNILPFGNFKKSEVKVFKIDQGICSMKIDIGLVCNFKQKYFLHH